MEFIKTLRSNGPTKKASLKERFAQVSTKLGGIVCRDQKFRQNEDLRKNQRNNIITACRIQSNKDFKGTQEVDVGDVSSLESTFVLTPRTRRKRNLDEWREHKKVAATVVPIDKRPIFKVTHCDSRLLERPLKPIAKSYSFAALPRLSNRDNTTMNHSTFRHNSTVLAKPVLRQPTHYFGKNTAAQFTFTATFPEFLKDRRESSPIKELDHSPIKESPNFPEFNAEDMLKDLTAKDREFLNETMEGRNKIKGLKTHASLNHIKTTEESIETNNAGYFVMEQGGNLNRKSIEKLTTKINETLVITPKIQAHKEIETSYIDDTANLFTPALVNNFPSCSTVHRKFTDRVVLDSSPFQCTPINKQGEDLTIVTAHIDMTCDKQNSVIIANETDTKALIINNPNGDTLGSIKYYRGLVVEQTALLDDLANNWLKVCDEVVVPPISEDNQGDIRCACGLAKLLIVERFGQFGDLIDKCEDTNTNVAGNKELDSKLVLASDLQGFWDMIYHQVVDVEKRFLCLSKLRLNNWVELEVEAVPVKVKTDVKKFKAKINPLSKNKSCETGSDVKAKAKAKPVCSRFAEFKAKMQKNPDNVATQDEIVVEIVTKPEMKVPEEIVEEALKTVEIKDKRKSTRNSILPDITLENLIDCPVENQGKVYNLRKNRRSDLIKWDSPSKNNSPRRTVNKGIFSLPNDNPAIDEGSETLSETITTTPDIVFDFEEDYQPIAFVKKPEVNKENVNGCPSRAIGSPKTPHNNRQRELQSKSGDDRVKSPQIFKNICNSPLLKLAMVSSHGKRQSLSAAKNLQRLQSDNSVINTTSENTKLF